MKKLKLLTIMAAATVVSASVYASPIFAADADINTETTIQSENIEEATEEVAEETEAVEETEGVAEVVALSEENGDSYDVTVGNVTIDVAEGSATNCVNPTFKITNSGSTDLDLSQVAIKYYYTADFAAGDDTTQTFNCYYAGTTSGNYSSLTSYVKGSVESTTAHNSDSVIVLTFTGGSLAAGQSMEVQANVNKNNWANYDRTNDYSYGNGDKIEVVVNGVPGGGTGEDNPPVINNSTLNTTSATFDKTYPADVTVGMNLNGNTLSSISGLNSSDYTVNGSTVTIKKSALQNLSVGSHSFTFNFSAGSSATFNLNVIQTSIPNVYTANIDLGTDTVKPGDAFTLPVQITGINADDAINGINCTLKYDASVLENVKVTAGGACANSSKTFTAKVNADGTIKIFFADTTGEDLELVTDGLLLTVTGNVKAGTTATSSSITVADKGCFSAVSEKEYNTVFSNGTITIDNVDHHDYFANIDLGTDSVKAGEAFTLPVQITGINADDAINGINCTLKYDPSKLENVKVTVGGACANGSKTFTAKVNADGTIKIFFADTTGEDTELVTDGLFFTITGNVKADAADGKTSITVADSGCFSAVSETEYKPTFTNGDINITGNHKEYNATIDLGTDDVVAGDAFTLPVQITGINADDAINGINCTLKYDASVLENVKVTAGSACANAGKTFTAKVNADGTIKIFFADTTGEDLELVTNGLLFTVTGNAKADTTATSSSITVADKGCFSAVSETEYNTTFSNGTIAITPKQGPDDNLKYDAAIDLGTDDVEAGEAFTLPVQITGINAEDAINGINCTLKYDASVLENVKVTAGSACTNGSKTFTAKVNADGTIKIFFADTTGEDTEVVTNGLLFTVTGNVKADTTATSSSITVTDKGCFSAVSEKEYNTTFSNGTVNITAPIITPPDDNQYKVTVDLGSAAAKQGESITLPAQITGISAEDAINGVNCTLKYDPSVLENVKVVAGDACTNGKKTFTAKVNADGTIKIFFADTTGEDTEVVTDGLFFTITADVKSDATVGTSSVAVTDSGCFSSVAEKEYAPTFTNGTIEVAKAEDIVVVPEGVYGSFDKVNTKVGETFTVPFNINGDISYGLMSISGKLTYDSSKLEVVSVDPGTIITNPDANFVSDYSVPGVVGIFFGEAMLDEANYIYAPGNVVNITFKAKASGTSTVQSDADGITLTNADFESVDGVSILPGTITIA